MASSIEQTTSISQCEIKFYWRKTVPCDSTSILLVLSSLTGVTTELDWKKDVCWYESSPIALPLGLHSGYILIRDELPSTYKTPFFIENDVVEREFKVDPFFVSAKKKSIELFVEKSRVFESWRDTPELRHRYLSSDNLKKKKESCSNRKWQSNNELCLQSRSPEVEVSSKGEDVLSSNSVTSDQVSVRESSSNLRKWHSLSGEKGTLRRSFDSSYYSRSRSLAGDDVSRSRESIEGVTPSKSDGDQVNSLFDSHLKSKTLKKSHSNNVLSCIDLNFLKFQTYKQGKELQCLFDSSDEENSAKKIGKEDSKKQGYGCLITLESRSASMDDVGSPRALEEVLVSLTSSDNTEAKLVGQFYSVQASQKESPILTPSQHENSHSSLVSSPKEKSIASYFQEVDSSSDFEGTDSQEIETEFTLNEDVNFQYESLNNDDIIIPLNLKDILDSEPSSLNCLQPPKNSPNLSITSSQEGGSDTVSNVGYYEVITNQDSHSSAKGEVATDYVKLLKPNDVKTSDYLCEKVTKVCVNKKTTSSSGSSKSSKMYKRYHPSVPPVVKKTVSASTATQTSSRIDPLRQQRAKKLTKCTQSYFYAPSIANMNGHKNFSPLPNKVHGPWSNRPKREDTQMSTQFGPSDLRSLQNNLHNLLKADKILRKIHTVQDEMVNRYQYKPKSRSSVRFTEPNYRRSQPNLEYTSPSSTFHHPQYSRRYESYVKSKPVQPTENISRPSIYGVSRPYYPPSKLTSSQTNRYLRNVTSMPDLSSDASESLPFSTPPPYHSRLQPYQSSSGLRGRSRSTSKLDYRKQQRIQESYHAPSVQLSNWDSSDSGGSTDSLIDEVDSLFINEKEPSRLSSSSLKSLPRRENRRNYLRKTPSAYFNRTSPTLDSNRSQNESSIGAIVRARSESDLRLVGPLTDGYQGMPPYLPYRKEQLSLGQVVKVLVPGGVALARVVYTPSNARLFPNYQPDNEDITVVLISEPTHEEWIWYAEGLAVQSPRNAFSLPPDFECPPLCSPFLSEEDLRRPFPTNFSRTHHADFVIQMPEDPLPLPTISNADNGYLVSTIQDNETNKIGELHEVCPNPFIVCNRTYCLVRCVECATANCCHIWTCTCMCNALHNSCKHIHVIQQHEQSHVVTPLVAAVGCQSDIQTTLMNGSVPDTDTSDGSGSQDQRRNMLAWIAKLNHGATHLSQSSEWYKDNEGLINESLNTYNPTLFLPVSKKRTRENVPGFF